MTYEVLRSSQPRRQARIPRGQQIVMAPLR
uniref:Uncharacterized protein n=1 Tax=Siphoviridae sp. ctcK97 TaxID=2825571 RepID=A0A8S5UB40_9CAUD|nr:MAG TPA: hypothetical protein [Siphoviridae sp. ctcK97]